VSDSFPKVVAPSPELIAADDLLRRDEIEHLADLAASYWRSAAEAAYRDDRLTLLSHCRQIRLVTLHAFHVVKSLGSSGEIGSAA
jgi:hypothetical protein